MSSAISKDLQIYLKTIETGSKDVLMDGYFHVDYVIDAFQKGEENGGKKAIEKIKDKFTRSSTQMFLYGMDLIKHLDEAGYPTEDFFVNPFSFKFLIVIEKEFTYNEEYIDVFFEKSFELQDKFKNEFGLSTQYLFVQKENLNKNMLKADGFLILNHE